MGGGVGGGERGGGLVSLLGSRKETLMFRKDLKSSEGTALHPVAPDYVC